MRNKRPLLLLAAFLLATPLMAGHRHGRDCGHYYEPRRGWISIEVFGRHGGFAYRQAPRYRYYDDYYYDGPRRVRYCERRCRHRHRHFYQPRGRGHGHGRHHHHRGCGHGHGRGRW